jgi:hypothetical protein
MTSAASVVPIPRSQIRYDRSLFENTMAASTAVRPVNLMFGSYQRRILVLLLLRPDEAFHVREISRLTSAPAGSLHRELKTLTEAGLLTGRNQVRYRADGSATIFPVLSENLSQDRWPRGSHPRFARLAGDENRSMPAEDFRAKRSEEDRFVSRVLKEPRSL